MSIALVHECQLAHADERTWQKGGILIADLISVFALFNVIEYIHERDDQADKRAISRALSQFHGKNRSM